jgi:uncharacterized membrane protein
MEDHDLRRVMLIVVLIIILLALSMIVDSIVIRVSLATADSIVRAFNRLGIPVYYFYNESWNVLRIVSAHHDSNTIVYLVVIISLIIMILIWIIVRRIARPRVNGLDV